MQTWASLDIEIVTAAILSLVMLVTTAALHYEALHFLARVSNGHRISRRWIVVILASLVTVHLAEVALYAGAYAVGTNVLSLGGLRGSSDRAALDFFYFAAETYSTLGYGDLVPVGALRLIASVESLNGLLLLSWSGAFLFGVLRDVPARRR
ncbi:MAG: potassium channel family protein [Gammaproteobacteria bacterium]